MDQLNIIAIFKIKPEFSTEFQEELNKLVVASRQDWGCIQYLLNQDITDANTYIITDKWQSQQAIDKHNIQPHFKHFFQFCEGKLNQQKVHIFKQIL